MQVKHKIKLIPSKSSNLIDATFVLGVKFRDGYLPPLYRSSEIIDDEEWLKFGKGYDLIILDNVKHNKQWRCFPKTESIGFSDNWNEFENCNPHIETEPILATSIKNLNKNGCCFNIQLQMIEDFEREYNMNRLMGEILVHYNQTPSQLFYSEDVPYSSLTIYRGYIICEPLKTILNSYDLKVFKSQNNDNFLEFIYRHLINVHGENPNFDYMIKLKEIVETINQIRF